MAMTRLQVANTAIQMLSSVPLESWGESTVNGILAAAHLPFALKQVLRETPWSDTIHVLELEESDQVDPIYKQNGFTYAYALPMDMFHLIEVNGRRTGWQMVDGVLHTNEPNPDLLYQTEPDDDSIPDDVGHCTAFLLAYYMAPTITQDMNKAAQMLQQYSMITTNEKQRVEQQLGNRDESPGWWTE